MKKQLSIRIDIKDTVPGQTSVRVMPGSPDACQIYVRDDIYRFTTAHNPVLCAVLHELGHFLGNVFQFSGQLGDPRNPFGKYLAENKHAASGQRIMNAEAEAWDLAEMILQLQLARKECLAGYRNGSGMGYKPTKRIRLIQEVI